MAHLSLLFRRIYARGLRQGLQRIMGREPTKVVAQPSQPFARARDGYFCNSIPTFRAIRLTEVA